MKRRLTLITAILIILFILGVSGCSETAQIRRVSESPDLTPVPLISFTQEKNEAPDEAPSFTSAPAFDSATLVITEISAADKDWIEFYNAGISDLQLSDYSIGSSPVFSEAEQLPEYVLAPGCFVCVYGKQEENSLKAGFSVNKAGDSLYLFDHNSKSVISISTPALGKNVSYALKDGAWGYTYFKTPGSKNTDFIFAEQEPEEYTFICPLEISEVLAGNSFSTVNSYGEYSDFAEIHNVSDQTVDLSGWFLSDSKGEPAKWAFPAILLEPDAYIAVYLSGGQSSDTELHASFSLNEEEELILFNGKENKYCSFSLPDVVIRDISNGSNGAYYRFPTPGTANSSPALDIADVGCYFADDAYISEICAFGDDTDWVELYNGADRAVDLTGWHLTDTLDDPEKYPIGSYQLEAGTYFIIKTSAHTSEQKADTAPFGISVSGERLYLIDSEGRVRDTFRSGMLDGAASSGRIEGKTDLERVFFAVSTPGNPNSESYFSGRTPAPVFSHTNLYCDAPFDLVLTCGEGAEIYYTNDGSEPKASSKNLYTSPIRISKNTVIRAFSVKEGRLASSVATYTYLFEEPHALPVICISMSPSDKNDVWSAKSKQSKTKVEREGFLSYYEADGKQGVSFPAGFKPKGAGTLGRSQASLSIHLRGMYGQSKVTYPFFKEYGWETYASLVVRNSGQDYLKARIRDSLASRICLGLNIDVAATRPVVVYVNGKYYGLYDLNEDQNADYLHTHFGVEQSSVEIIRFNTTAVKGANTDWKRVIEFAKTKDFKKSSVYSEFSQWVDTDYFIDYLVCSIYLCNSDMANQKYWHTADNNIRWRPILYDFDYAMGFNRSAKSSIIGNFFDPDGTATATSRVYTHIACALVKNPEWRQKFIERFIELTYTTFDPSRVSMILEELAGEMEPEMPRHIEHWGSRNAPSSVKEWRSNIKDLEEWFAQRQKYAIESLKKYFKLKDEEIEQIKAKYI